MHGGTGRLIAYLLSVRVFMFLTRQVAESTIAHAWGSDQITAVGGHKTG